MSNNLTKRQHYVPQFYLRAWATTPNSNCVHYYDLITKKREDRNPEKILWEPFMYEEDPNNPDNRIENMLSRFETKAAPIFSELILMSKHYGRTRNKKKFIKKLMFSFSEENIEILKDFAVFQYIRTKHALAQKMFELDASSLSKEQKGKYFNLGRFVDEGFNYIRPNFNNLIIAINFTFTGEFFTSDWPFFDMKDSDFAPALGEELGVDPDVIGQFALTPKLTALFLHKESAPELANHAGLIADQVTKTDLVNFNEMVIDQAVKYVVSTTNQEKTIFDRAAIRKRETHPELFE